ncbi:uncharacterized protein MELLADRAFT_90689 [Melampsora larici-populina 98AG31]|uniref:Uncharacterized protein n=1 Tax=Melampsora larici-populina (strain 98AG31 / pathotype 3-4-7) TaxID=747676 RepID=F4RXT4_MELLP|nr:uncharacterized protein MELLADRAFT_90689 [Melampsora larici-populina 98AG31]EGG02784.1 hypothetical protein MELLADRAFT_90689 [Melampsora larici-populina 98AG31]
MEEVLPTPAPRRVDSSSFQQLDIPTNPRPTLQAHMPTPHPHTRQPRVEPDPHRHVDVQFELRRAGQGTRPTARQDPPDEYYHQFNTHRQSVHYEHQGRTPSRLGDHQRTRLPPRNPPPARNQQCSNQRENGRSQSDLDEEEQVRSFMSSKKGRFVLRNGDVVENGRLLIADESKEMEKGLNQMSPVLTHWLRTFKSYIPLTAFNKIFLAGDQAEWSRRKAPSESKIEDGSASLRVYGGAPPPDELLMQFEDWIDVMTLFIRYVTDAGWQTLPERFEGHRRVVMEIREHYGWMIALRYCIRIRQGVMRDTIDGKIKNFSHLQSAIFEEVKIIADSRQERAYRTNPYVENGPLSHMNPMTGLAKPSALPSSKRTAAETFPAKTVKAEPTSGDWIPSAKWRTMSKDEKTAAKRDQQRSSRRRDDDRGREKDRYYERSDYCDRGKDYQKRSPSRSRSPRGGRGKGRNRRS